MLESPASPVGRSSKMRLTEIFTKDEPCFSFEFFPPKTEQGVKNLFDTISALEPLAPGYVSVTYGAGGTTRDLTLELVSRIKQETSIEAMAHLTCVGSTRAEIKAHLQRMKDAGIENVLALRGDPPKGETEFVPAKDGLRYADELITFIRENDFDFCIGGACYPEPHPDSDGDAETDLANLKRKVDAGANFLITQLYFDNALYFDFVVRARQIGIKVPIIPGIMPVTNAAQIERFTRMAGASIPTALREALRDRAEDGEAVLELGVAYATAQCAELLRYGVPGIHFYTLNRSPATRAIVTALKILQPWKSGVHQ